MAIIATIGGSGTKRVITPVDDGHFLVLGNVADDESGFWRVQLVPNTDFVGGIAVLGRSSGKESYDDGVNFGTVPYRVIQRGGISADPSVLVQTSTPAVPVVTDAIILIPAQGLSIALGIDCQAGSATLYMRSLRGIPL